MARADCLHLHLQFCLELCLLLSLLVALLQVLHEHGDHHVHQDELGCQHEGDEVDGRNDGVVAGGLLVTVSQGVLETRGEWLRGVRRFQLASMDLCLPSGCSGFSLHAENREVWASFMSRVTKYFRVKPHFFCVSHHKQRKKAQRKLSLGSSATDIDMLVL